MSDWHKVLICGDREWLRHKPIRDTLRMLERQHGSKLLIITGGARGADKIAEVKAKKRGIHVAVVDALWDAHDKKAGPMRNAAMAALEPDEVIAFHSNLAESTGTTGMLKIARRKGIRARRYG